MDCLVIKSFNSESSFNFIANFPGPFHSTLVTDLDAKCPVVESFVFATKFCTSHRKGSTETIK